MKSMKAKKEFESDDVEVIKKALESLTNVSNEVFTKMYQNAQANAQTNANEEKKDDKKNDDGDPEVVID